MRAYELVKIGETTLYPIENMQLLIKLTPAITTPSVFAIEAHQSRIAKIITTGANEEDKPTSNAFNNPDESGFTKLFNFF